MRVAIYGKSFPKDSRPYIENLYEELKKAQCSVYLFGELDEFIKVNCQLDVEFKVFNNHKDLREIAPKFLITIGGDGTILDAATLVRKENIPILGINTGRLGFLANVSKEEIPQALQALFNGQFKINNRRLLSMHTSSDQTIDPNFALNEVTVSRKDTTSMITVHTYINDEYLNSYWADGLIVATPTGSTGYSLSCGGPIIMPGSENFVITPIAPHNLNVRPFVIPNNYTITLKVETREKEFLTSLDSRIYTFSEEVEIKLKCADFQIQLVQTDVQDFPTTLRNKLLWGLDRRN